MTNYEMILVWRSYKAAQMKSGKANERLTEADERCAAARDHFLVVKKCSKGGKNKFDRAHDRFLALEAVDPGLFNDILTICHALSARADEWEEFDWERLLEWETKVIEKYLAADPRKRKRLVAKHTATIQQDIDDFLDRIIERQKTQSQA